MSALGLFSLRRKCRTSPLRWISNKAWIKRHNDDFYVKEAKHQDLRSRSAFKLIEIQQKYKFMKRNDVIVDLGSAPGGWCLAAQKVLNELTSKQRGSKSKESQQMPAGGSADSAPVTDGVSGPGSDRIFAVDLLPMETIPGVHFIQGNFLHRDVQQKLVDSIRKVLLDARKGQPRGVSGEEAGEAGSNFCSSSSSSSSGSSSGVSATEGAGVAGAGAAAASGGGGTSVTTTPRAAVLSSPLIDVLLSDMLHNTTGSKSMDHYRSMELAQVALQFASIHLKSGGNLVFKALMGEDFKSLITDVADPLFRKVHVIKPKASRSESSEVYVLCAARR